MPRAVVYTFYLDPRRAGYFMMGHIAHKHLIKEPIEVRRAYQISSSHAPPPADVLMALTRAAGDAQGLQVPQRPLPHGRRAGRALQEALQGPRLSPTRRGLQQRHHAHQRLVVSRRPCRTPQVKVGGGGGLFRPSSHSTAATATAAAGTEPQQPVGAEWW